MNNRINGTSARSLTLSHLCGFAKIDASSKMISYHYKEFTQHGVKLNYNGTCEKKVLQPIMLKTCTFHIEYQQFGVG